MTMSADDAQPIADVTIDASDSPRPPPNALDGLFLMRRVVEQTLTLVPGAEGVVFEFLDGQTLTCVCASGSLQHMIGVRHQLSRGLSGLALRTATTLISADSSTDDRVDQALCRDMGVRSMICVPLLRSTTVVGVLKLGSSRPGAFDTATAALLDRLAAFIGIAIGGWSDLADSAATTLISERRAQDTPNAARAGENKQRSAATERLSQFVANVLRPSLVDDRDARHRIESVLNGPGMTIRFQPILDLKTDRIAGYEALARFAPAPVRPPDLWFAEAQRVGLGAQLQLAAVAKALARLPDLPPRTYLAVNVGHDIVGTPQLLRLLHSVDSRNVIIELTEHLHVEDYPALIGAVRRIRATGARLAIDDTGAGFASFSSILQLAPDLIKLDRILTTGVDVDPARQALAGALVTFAAATGAKVIAEGIETDGELHTIRHLGIGYGQGYLLGRAAQLPHLPNRPTKKIRQAPTDNGPPPSGDLHPADGVPTASTARSRP